jgi:hypothetical protein
MSLKAITWVCDLSGCNSSEKAVLFVLANAHNGKTGKCFPSQELIAAQSGMSDRTLRKVFATLIMKGLISRKITSKGKGLRTDYTLNFDLSEPRDMQPASATQPNGIRGPVASDTPTGKRVPFAKPAPKRNTGSDRSNRKDGGPNGTRLPDQTETVFRLHIEEPEVTGIPSQDSSESFEGRSADLFNLPHVVQRIDKRSPSKPTSRNADPFSAEKDFIFKNGVQLLVAQGCTEQTSRSFLGKLVRDWKPKPVAEAIKAAVFEKVGDAKSWIPAALKKRKSELSVKAAPTPETAGADEWAAAIKGWAETGYWPSARLGLAPNQVGYRGPIKPLEELLPSLGDHPAAREIRSTINLRASA